jgi:tRNA(Ile)-lysidine synthase
MAIHSSLFFRHVQNFIHTQVGRNPARKVVVALSGGIDSRLLCEFAVWLLEQGDIAEVRAVSVHHHTRAGQDADMILCQRAAQLHDLEWTQLDRTGAMPESNIEEVLRRERFELLKANLRSGEELWLGQHIDDSWEWSQLQAARSSEVRSGLGIPMKNGPLLRPFMCVTRAQIQREAEKRTLVWREDPTNLAPRFARTFFRHKIHPAIKEQHPQFLKHYARRSQRLAQELGVALKKKSRLAPSRALTSFSSTEKSTRAH